MISTPIRIRSYCC